MGSRWGSDLACEVCGQRYRDLRTGHTFAGVKRLMRRAPNERWRYRRRHGVLGFWHGIKVLEWNHHVEMCWVYSGQRGRAPLLRVPPSPEQKAA